MLALAFLALITVEGRVVDAVTQQPVGEARVVLLRDGQSYSFATWTTPVTENPAADAPVISVRTNDLGVFRFEVNTPAKFRLFVSKDRYVRDSESRFDLSADRKDLQIRLMPEAVISGRVIDVETQKPVQGFAVTAHSYRSTGGGRALLRTGDPGKTDEEGRFRVAGLAPGEYYLELNPPLGAAFGKPKEVEDFANDARMDYGGLWYPGVARREEAAPVMVLAGGTVNGLDLKVARRRLAVIRGTVSSLGDGGEVTLMLISIRREIHAASFGVAARGAVKAGEGFELERLEPGQYFLAALGPGSPEERLAAYRHFELDDHNLDLGELLIQRGLDVAGKVTVEGAEEVPSLEKMTVALTPRLRMSMGEKAAEVDAASGAFLLRNQQPETFIVYAGRAPKGFGVREIRYNGTLLVHGLLELDPGSHRQELEVVLAPASSAIQATVTDGTSRLEKATVLMVQDPVTPEIMRRLRPYFTDNEGSVTIPGLLPGKYRVLAFPAGVAWANDPLLGQRLSSAQEVNVDANTTATIQIRAVMQ